MIHRSCGVLVLVGMFSVPVNAVQQNQQMPDSPASAWTCQQAKSSSTQRNHDEYIRDVNACIGDGDYASALSFALRNQELALASGDTEQILRAKVIESAAYRYLDLMPQALELLRQVIEDPRTAQIPFRLYTAYNNYADILMLLDRLEEAEEAANQAQKLVLVHGDEDAEATVNGTIGQIALRLGRFAEAKVALEKCITLGQRLNDGRHQVLCRMNLAELALAQKSWKEAYTQAGKALQHANELGYRTELPLLHLVQAKAKLNLLDKSNAIALAETGLKIARERGELRSSLSLLQFLQDVWLKAGDIVRAQQVGIEIQSLSRELFDQRLANTLAAERARFELSSKEQEIAALKQQNALQQASAETARAQRTAAISISLFALAVFAIGYGRWMHRRDLQRAEAANAELKRLNELKDQFLANTSHELRTPLNGIIGLSDIILVEEQARLSPEAQDNLRMIRDCGNQLSQLVDDILDFSRLRAEKLTLNKQPMQLVDAVDDVVKLLRPLATAKGLHLSSRMPADLPVISADGDRIRQVLHNLIGNAIKFTEQGSVTVEAERQASGLRVNIRDTGVGIPADRLERIFEPFEQADGSSGRRYGGAGLGLSIARQLVVAHGGTLTVLSEPGRGSVFSFTLPLT